MNNHPFEQSRIQQLTSTYEPDHPPRLALDFGDYLSLVWRLDRSGEHSGRAQYYRQCAIAVSAGLGIQGRSLCRLVTLTQPGEIYRHLPNAPYRGTGRLLDARDHKSAIAELVMLREDILRMGTRSESWTMGWPGSGIQDEKVRERVFALLFTALQGQYAQFARLLLVLDIVLANLLLGIEPNHEVPLEVLVGEYQYPDPYDDLVRRAFYSEVAPQ